MLVFVCLQHYAHDTVRQSGSFVTAETHVIWQRCMMLLGVADINYKTSAVVQSFWLGSAFVRTFFTTD